MLCMEEMHKKIHMDKHQQVILHKEVREQSFDDIKNKLKTTFN